MSAIKTPVRVAKGCGTVFDAEGMYALGAGSEAEAREATAAINATLGIGLTVEAMEQNVIGGMINVLRDLPPAGYEISRSEYDKIQARRDAILALIPAAPNSEAGKDDVFWENMP